ncbi:hypothetical protein K474DRAFT_1658497 [Panus rudis PR-1116 ss-1]|nr:hypothetical protein K474DRAFT_1658497 [Panus rudis PR-1116 ss-1]
MPIVTILTSGSFMKLRIPNTSSLVSSIRISVCHGRLNRSQLCNQGEYRPEEDTEWEAYTLGRAPPTLDPGADLTVAEEAALAANVELARGPGSRYLVQRWGDGTYCDKTGKKREVEVQFHCSMTMTDTILFVKETQTCRYVIHIATPRLCGEPGFRSRLDAREEAQIRCREIMDEEAYQTADRSLPTADRPLKMPRKAKPGIVAPPPASRKEKDMNQGNQAQSTAKKTQQDLIRKALERLLETGGLTSGEVIIESLDGDDGVIVEYIETDLELDPEETPTTQDESLGADPGSRRGDANRGKSPSLEDVLRAAGYGIKGEKTRAGNGRSTRGGEEEASNSKTAQRKSDEEEEDSVRGRRKSGRDEL